MKLSGLVDTLITDPVVAEAVRDAKADGVTTLDLSAPTPVRPVLLAALASEQNGAGRPVLAVTATFREAEELTEALQCLVEPGTVAVLPGLGDPAARAPLAPLRHGRPASRRAAPPRPPGSVGRRRPGRSRSWSRRCGRCCSRRSPAWRPGAGAAARRRRRSTSTTSSSAGRTRRTPGRPGRAARRVRGPRRHPRRLPADRGAPAAGRVLGRRRRGDPLLRGRRPALARDRRARAVGAALPRAAAHRRGPRRGPRVLAERAPGAGRDARQARRGHRGRGHGVARPGARRRAWSCWSTCMPAGTHVSSATPSGSAPGRTTWSRTSQEFLEASLGGGRRWRRGADRPRRGGVHVAGRRPGARRWARAGLVDHVAVRRWRRRGRAEPRHSMGGRGPRFDVDPDAGAVEPRDRRARGAAYRGETAAALADVRGWLGDGWRGRRCVTEGHGPAQRAGRGARASADLPAPAGRRPRRRRRAGRAVRDHRAGSSTASSPSACRLAVLTETDLAGGRGASTKDMRSGCRAAGASAVDPLRAPAPATTSCTSSTASAATSRWCSARSHGRRPASTW